jgi:hypothetical protein
MRSVSKALLALSLATLGTTACSGFAEPEVLDPSGTGSIPTAGPTGPGGTGTGTNPTGTTPTGTTPTGSTPTGTTPDFPNGNPGDSPTGGDGEREQGFTGWRLEVLPSGELRLRFRQVNLTVASFQYVVGAQIEGDVQCYNKADNAPQGQPFSFTLAASATLGAQSLNGTIDATLSTTVLQDACGNTQFEARPVTTMRPWQWTNVYLDNPAGRLPLPNVKLGDAPLGFSL